MRDTVRRQVWYVLAVMVAGATMAAGGPKFTLSPVTADFRCPLSLDCVAPDRIQGDTSGSYRGAPAAPEQGPYFNSESNFYFPLQPGRGRFISIDFSAPVAAPPCAADGSCRKIFTTVFTDSSLPASITNPLDAAGTSLPNGFLSIAVGQSARSRYKLNFADPNGRALLWTVRFNSEMFPGSTELTVTRTAINTWVIEATDSDVAELVSSTTSGKPVTVHEGYYTMPFRVTVTR